MSFKCVLFSLLLTTLGSEATHDFDVYGPGWQWPQLIFPSRYFFVQHFGHKRVTNVRIEGRNVGRNNRLDCRIWTQVFNETAFDGLLVVRYKLVSSECVHGIVINLLNAENEVLAYKEIADPIYAEECVCQLSDWSKLMRCDSTPELYTQIYNDLRPFNNSKFNFEDALSEAKRRFAPHTKSYSFCHYVILNNEIHRQCYGEYVGFAQFMDDMLVSLLSKTSLPNTQFIVNLGDWPLSDNRRGSVAMPIFSWCGSDDTFDIVLPTYELTESTLKMQGRVSLDVLSVFGEQKVPFEEKTTKLFWRGRDSNRLRLKLIELSKEHPNLIDAAFTNFFFFRDEMDKYGPTVPYSNFLDFFAYKYQLNVDGTVASYRMPLLMAGTSLILKPQSQYYEHFYHLLEENVHFVGVERDLNNLLPVLKHLINNLKSSKETTVSKFDNQTSTIENTRNFVLNYLLPSNIFCYYYKALTEYSSLLKSDVKVLKNMKLVFTTSESDCRCRYNEETKDEL